MQTVANAFGWRPESSEEKGNANAALNEANGQLSQVSVRRCRRFGTSQGDAATRIKTFHTGVSEDFLASGEEKFKDLRATGC